MKKVLLISYHFPPDSEVGGLRIQKYAKYLPLYGWTPIVLTVDHKYYPDKDFQRLNDVNCIVSRTSVLPGMRDIYLGLKRITLQRAKPERQKKNGSSSSITEPRESTMSLWKKFLLNLIWLPDDRTGWIIPALTRGITLARKNKIDAIVTTSPPHSVQLIGLLMKIVMQKRWIVDFRDPWNIPMGGDAGFFRNMNGWLESTVVRNADLVVTATEQVREYLIGSYPSLGAEKFICIPNGYDLDDFRNRKVPTSGLFEISYIGDFYLGRSPETYLQAVSELIRDGIIDKNKIRLRFVGKVRYYQDRPLEDILSALGIHDVSEIMDIVPYQSAIEYMLSSAVLVVISPQNFMQPMKAFEYMASGSYVLAFTPAGSLADLVNRYSKGFVVDDLEGAKKAIQSCYDGFIRNINNSIPAPELNDYVLSFERRNLTRRLSECL